MEAKMEELKKRPRPYSCCGDSKFISILDLCKDFPISGPVIEIGVYKGGMAMHLAQIFINRNVYLVDTFTGIPYQSEYDNFYGKGSFNDVNVDDVVKTFADFDNVTVLQGLFPDDFHDRFDDMKFAVVHIDVDVYDGYKNCLEYLYPRTLPGGIIFLDDYNISCCNGCTVACNEFIKEVPEAIELLNEQYYIRKV